MLDKDTLYGILEVIDGVPYFYLLNLSKVMWANLLHNKHALIKDS